MFSEYASRFLAQSQSQSRFSNFGGQADNTDNNQPNRFARNLGRSTYSRGLGNPYQPSGSRFGNLPFASRYSAAPDAPLFHSALDDFREEDEEEDAREAADFRALQRSRRVFAASRLEESSASENEASRASLERSEDLGSRTYADRGRPMGIKSSWNGTRSNIRGPVRRSSIHDEAEDLGHNNWRRESSGSDDAKGKMVDVGLESEMADSQPPDDLLREETPIDGSPPAFQQFKSTTGTKGFFTQRETNLGGDARSLRRTSNEETVASEENGLVPGNAPLPVHGEIFKHDQFWAWLYLIAIASLLATFVLVFLHTSAPSRKNPLGDTIYTTLHSSFHLLAVDTFISIVVSLVWLAALRSLVKPLVLLILIAVPIVLFSFSLYPMVSSFQGRDHGSSVQDVVMRYAAIVPGVSAIIWVYLVYQSRYALRRAIEILEFSSRILAANPALITLGFVSLAAVVGWTWVWLSMFTRVFLGGYFSRSLSTFIISAATWWLGVYFFLMYIWTLSIMSGVVRGTTGATVSHWYFHRNKVPEAASNEVVSEALKHALTTIFGTISASTLLSLVVRLPLIALPRRLAGFISVFAYQFVPTPVATLTNPLALTYASIHSQPLMQSAAGLSRMQFLSPQAPTTTLTPRAFSSRRGSASPLLPYRLAKLLLHAARFVMSTALGFAAWVMTARQLRVALPDGIGVRGSAYAYVVGMVASLIGWGILGAMEGILSGILDAVVVCYGSERRMMGAGGAGYCMEAAYLFGDRGDDRDMV